MCSSHLPRKAYIADTARLCVSSKERCLRISEEQIFLGWFFSLFFKLSTEQCEGFCLNQLAVRVRRYSTNHVAELYVKKSGIRVEEA